MNPPTNLVLTLTPCEEVELPFIGRVQIDFTPPTDYLERELLSAQVGANYTGTSTVINVIVGKGYYWTRGANETSIAYFLLGDETPIVDNVNATTYFLPTKNFITIVHANNAAVTATLSELRVQTYRWRRDGVVVEDKVSIKHGLNDITVPANRIGVYTVEAIAANGDRGLSAEISTGYWVKSFGSFKAGVNSQDSITGMAVDSEGNVVITGFFLGTLYFPTGTLESATGGSCFLAKYNRAGAVLWAMKIGGNSGASTTGLAVDSGGNILIQGGFRQDLNLGGDTFPFSGQNAGNPQIFIAKLDPDGEHLWSKAFIATPGNNPTQSTGNLRAISITTDSNDNVISVGFFENEITFDGGSNYLGSPFTGAKGYVTKFNPSGVNQWSKYFQCSSDSQFVGVDVDSGDNIIINGLFGGVGRYWGDGTDLTSGGLVFPGTSTSPMIIKVDSDGDHIWSVGFTNTYATSGFGVAVTSTDDIVLTGFYFSDITIGGIVLTGGSLGALWIAKLDGDGEVIWAKGAAAVRGGPVALDADGNVYVAGTVITNTTIDGNPILVNQQDGINGMILRRAAADGAFIGLEQFVGPTSSDAVSNIVIEGEDMIVAGTYQTSITIDGIALTAVNGNDAFFVRRPITPCP